jgi:lipoprotein-anchoring transpeptidase ErfK/SrfK
VTPPARDDAGKVPAKVPAKPTGARGSLRSIAVNLARRSTLGLFVFALVLGACGGGDGSPSAQVRRRATTRAPATTTTPPTPTTTTVPAYISYLATVKPELTSIGVFPSPETPEPSQQLPNPWLYEAGNPASAVPQVFLVESQRADGWVQVLLPVRPNGSVGWVHTSDVTLTPNPFRVEVALGAHTITVTNADAVVYRGPVAVGAPATPTPTGNFYLYVLLQAPDPTGPYGPFAYGLSSHSDALATFAGGDAEIGIHGNDDASALGQSVSHGCIRMDNAAITALAGQLPLGTPVTVNA